MARYLIRLVIMDAKVITVRTLGKQTSKDELPFVEKHRPQEISDVVGQDHITNTLMALLDAKQLPHLLFYGPPGVGKTSLALAVAHKLNGLKLGLLTIMINASDKNDIKTVRKEIHTFVNSKSLWESHKIKFVILDEVDHLGSDAQLALRQMIEKYSRGSRFCLICNDQNKLIPALQSRCARFRFNPLSQESMVEKLNLICVQENILYQPDVLATIVKISNGDMRTGFSILESIQNEKKFQMNDTLTKNQPDEELKVSITDVYTLTGKPTSEDIVYVFNLLLNETLHDSYNGIQELMIRKEYSLYDLLYSLHEVILYSATFQNEVLGFIILEFGKLELQINNTSHPLLQLGALVGIFAKVALKLTSL